MYTYSGIKASHKILFLGFHINEKKNSSILPHPTFTFPLSQKPLATQLVLDIQFYTYLIIDIIHYYHVKESISECLVELFQQTSPVKLLLSFIVLVLLNLSLNSSS